MCDSKKQARVQSGSPHGGKFAKANHAGKAMTPMQGNPGGKLTKKRK